MSNFEFVSYVPTPTEKHLGIATVKAYGKFILRYKVIPTKDGQNFFPAPASYKIGEAYVHAFQLDSNSDKEELENLIKNSVRPQVNTSKHVLPQKVENDFPF